MCSHTFLQTKQSVVKKLWLESTVVEAGGRFARSSVVLTFASNEPDQAMALIANRKSLDIDASSIVLTGMHSIAGRTGDIAVGANAVRIIAREDNKGGRCYNSN